MKVLRHHIDSFQGPSPSQEVLLRSPSVPLASIGDRLLRRQVHGDAENGNGADIGRGGGAGGQGALDAFPGPSDRCIEIRHPDNRDRRRATRPNPDLRGGNS